MFRLKRLWGVVASLLAVLVSTVVVSGCGCGEMFGDGCRVNLPPTLSGQVDLSTSTSNTIVATWTAATDDATPAADLKYQVVYSKSNNISTVTDALANGTVGTAWTANITKSTISALDWATTYYVAVLVEDQAQSRSIYPIASRKTDDPPVVLSNGGQVTCPTGTVMNGFGGRKGDIVDQLFLQCAPESDVKQSTSSKGPGIGATGGVAFTTFICPDGAYVTQISGGNALGSFTTALASFIATCSDGAATKSTVYATPRGNTLFNYSCPVGQKPIGVDAGATPGGAYAGFVNGILCR